MCSDAGENGCDAEVLKSLERLLRAGRRHCRTGEEAKDAVQDTYVTAAMHMEDFRGDGSLEGWLVRIVASACRRMSRGQKNDPNRHDDDLALADAALLPEADPLALTDWLDRALLSLPEEDRLVLLLASVEGMEGPEIAAQLEITPNAARARLFRARAKLREALLALE